MKLISFASLLAGMQFLSACGTVPEKAVTTENEGARIAAVFETPQPYSRRTVDSLDLAQFLLQYPEYKSDSTAIVDFYHRRGMQYAWVLGDSLTGSADAFIALAGITDTLTPSATALGRTLHDLYDRGFEAGRRIALCDTCALDLELRLTAQFFRFAERKYGGYLSHDLRELSWFIPRGKKDPSRLLDSIANGRMDLRAYEPIHPQYQRIKDFIPHYHELAKNDWPVLELPTGTRKLVNGDSADVIPGIRHRLFLLGDMAVADSSTHYDSTLVVAVQRFQTRHGLLPDAVIGAGFIQALNVPISDRLRTMLVNLERLRWLPERQSPDLLLVNIPDFRLYVYENDTVVLSMDVVVGTAATRTVIFSDTLSQVVFSPTWTVPMSITRGEILPAMKKDPDYLRKKNMEVIGGSASNPIIRQKPGANNALGRVKFLFPNSYSIYFHDTPSKSFFARESRAFSHGCIRLSKPQDLATYLLKNQAEWTPEKIKQAMYGGKETFVRLTKKRPVTIGYFTCFVDGDGRLNFRNDIYGHDERLGNELFMAEGGDEQANAEVKAEANAAPQ